MKATVDMVAIERGNVYTVRCLGEHAEHKKAIFSLFFF